MNNTNQTILHALIPLMVAAGVGDAKAQVKPGMRGNAFERIIDNPLQMRVFPKPRVAVAKHSGLWAKWVETGDTTSALSQEAVQALYEKYDALIGKDIEKAKREKKQYTLILGENHINIDALLTVLMLTDIANKHGVKLFGSENPVEGVKAADQFFDAINSHINTKVGPVGEVVRIISEELNVAPVFLHEQLKRSQFLDSMVPIENGGYENHTYFTVFARLLGMQHFGFDPLHNAEEQLSETVSPREAAMISTLKIVKTQPMLIVCGAAHMPILSDGLSEDKTRMVRAIDVTNSELYILDQSGNLLPWHGPRWERRQEFPQIIADGKSPAKATEALRMALTASLKANAMELELPSDTVDVLVDVCFKSHRKSKGVGK